ncbi:MAG TPA: prepilin-type N-terminal cleavage/methylation domain-containing protein [Clostridia bacterium]|jgi:prepilin-type N-terminal cleavage/methylation domain-containing protein|nr:prepilin-type N-terminal cleavage/methylation domain-containing protein [Clostridia bacterium]HHY06728.1 prepilin-type N-terminal cleavage/methylation domain-containing protein [Clostridia bacterium]
MLNKIREMFREQKGFTLVELMTVLVILSVILNIGVPSYLKIQSQAEYDADRITIANLARVAEVYMIQTGKSSVNLLTLTEHGLFNGETVLNRRLAKVGGEDLSIKNDVGNTLDKSVNYEFELDSETGKMKEYDRIVYNLIGPPVY